MLGTAGESFSSETMGGHGGGVGGGSVVKGENNI